MKKILLSGFALAVVASAGLATTSAFAASNQNQNDNKNNGYSQQMESKAKILGMSTDELKKQLQSKSMLEVAKEKGISQDKLHTATRESAEKRWKDRGLSDAQIKERKESMEKRQADCDGTGHEAGQNRQNGNRSRNS